jgi:hypothetical protein
MDAPRHGHQVLTIRMMGDGCHDRGEREQVFVRPFTRPGGQEVWLDAGPDRRVGFCSHGEWTRVEIDGEATMVVESSPAIEAIFGARK